mmetsp:Transcript_20353/g.47713  ORF Transcript_20353/g.47713 Transcript_20353/m.47713 type:complete len:425 (+) Transcript_20353:187-1461(+)
MAENRTNEFMALARSLPKNGGLPPQILSSPPPSSGSNNNNNKKNGSRSERNAAAAQLRDFQTTAGGISRDIASTSSMLAELTQLVRQKSLFQDDSQKVNELVIRIKTAIENLNGRLDAAERQSTQQKRTLGKNSQSAQLSSNVVGQLQEEFGQAAAGFKTILQQRTDVLKETTDRKRDIYGTGGAAGGAGGGAGAASEMEDIPVLNLENRPPVYNNMSSSFSSHHNNYDDSNASGGMGPAGFPTLDLTSGMMAAGEPTGSQLPRPHGIMTPNNGIGSSRPSYAGASSASSSYYGSGSGNSHHNAAALLSPFELQKREQESGQDQMMQLIPDQDYLRDRADAMEQVESNIVELGAVYNRLATMVHEHKDMVQRVEDNVDEANSMINLSLNTLTDTLTNLQSNRGLALKIFSILVVFIISFIVFFA